MSDTPEPSKVSAIKMTLAVIPALLIVSICVALYLGANADKDESEPYKGDVTIDEMSGYLGKLNGVIGERRIDTEEGQRAFRQLVAMTKGTFGTANLNFEVFQVQKDSVNGLLWPTVWVDAGVREADDIVVVAIPQAESGTGPAFAYGFAEYLTAYEMQSGVRIVFYPPLVEGDFEKWIWERCGREGETLKGVVKVTGGDSRDRETLFLAPSERGEMLKAMSESKLWSKSLTVSRETNPFLEVRLVEQGRFSEALHSQRLIRLMPVMKDLLDRLAK